MYIKMVLIIISDIAIFTIISITMMTIFIDISTITISISKASTVELNENAVPPPSPPRTPALIMPGSADSPPRKAWISGVQIMPGGAA
jgi:hypothetical protein